jgi:Phosphotransferase enzyme family
MDQLASPSLVEGELERLLGAPVRFRELKHKPGRRRTLRAHGAWGAAIVKLYGSERAAQIAARIAALADGPPDPRVPEVLLVEPRLRALVLSDVPGEPLSGVLFEGGTDAAARAGAALGRWHLAWRGREPAALRPHPFQRERMLLLRQAAGAPDGIARCVRRTLTELAHTLPPWRASTVVHRDLYEEHLVVGETVGLIDLDDAALGPPELDIGNLRAHVVLLERRSSRDLDRAWTTLVRAYSSAGPALDWTLVHACTRLALLRLACIHRREELVHAGTSEETRQPPPPRYHAD